METLNGDCMGAEIVDAHRFLNGVRSMAACWADDVGMAHDIDSYAHVEWVRRHRAKQYSLSQLVHIAILSNPL